MWHWMLGNGVTSGDAPLRPLDAAERAEMGARLNAAAGGDDAAKIEPSRVGAAYRLALAGEGGALALEAAFVRGAALYPASLARDPSTYGAVPAGALKVDGVERSAAYGLAALPRGGGVAALTRVAADPRAPRNKRALALHALGQCAPTVRALPGRLSAISVFL